MTASETLDSLDAVKYFAVVGRGKQINVMLNELIGEVETLKLQNLRQCTIHIICFLRNDVLSFSEVFIYDIFFFEKKSEILYSRHLFLVDTFFRDRRCPSKKGLTVLETVEVLILNLEVSQTRYFKVQSVLLLTIVNYCQQYQTLFVGQ